MTIRSVLLTTLMAACAIPALAQDCPTGANWCSGTYAYDGMGNIRAIGSDIYIYDTAGRLVSGTAEKQRGGASRQEFGYDAFGNRTSASRISGSVDCLGGCEQSPTIDPNTNHITSNGAQYDAAGNLISITNTVNSTAYTSTYTYDAAGNLARATAGSDDRQFLYTADGERIATRNGQSWTWTIRGLDGKVLREYTSLETSTSPLVLTSHTWSKDYIWRDGQLLATVEPTTPGANTTITKHFHLDHLGTPRVASNDAGVQIGLHAYYPFGTELNLGQSEGELMKFTGHERDLLASNPNTLDYMHARYDMSTMGRFLSIDPGRYHIDQPQSWNRYAYVGNNPITYSDPTGSERPWRPSALPSAENARQNTAALKAAAKYAGGVLDKALPVAMDIIAIGGTFAKFVDTGEGSQAEVEKLEADTSVLIEEAETALTDDALVVRGGQNRPDNFTNGSGVVQNGNGTLSNVSVQSANGKSVTELSQGLNHGQVGVSTVGAIKGAGGTITPTPNPGNQNHCVICDLTAEVLSKLFTPTITNPNRPQ